MNQSRKVGDILCNYDSEELLILAFASWEARVQSRGM